MAAGHMHERGAASRHITDDEESSGEVAEGSADVASDLGGEL
jgi:hypothetical protein